MHSYAYYSVRPKHETICAATVAVDERQYRSFCWCTRCCMHVQQKTVSPSFSPCGSITNRTHTLFGKAPWSATNNRYRIPLCVVCVVCAMNYARKNRKTFPPPSHNATWFSPCLHVSFPYIRMRVGIDIQRQLHNSRWNPCIYFHERCFVLGDCYCGDKPINWRKQHQLDQHPEKIRLLFLHPVIQSSYVTYGTRVVWVARY